MKQERGKKQSNGRRHQTEGIQIHRAILSGYLLKINFLYASSTSHTINTDLYSRTNFSPIFLSFIVNIMFCQSVHLKLFCFATMQYGNVTLEMTYGMRDSEFLSLGKILQHWREEMSCETILDEVNQCDGVDSERQTGTLCTQPLHCTAQLRNTVPAHWCQDLWLLLPQFICISARLWNYVIISDNCNDRATHARLTARFPGH